MRIGIVGAGAIGGWLAVQLAQQGHAINVLALEPTLTALRTKPWKLHTRGRSLEASVRASGDPNELGPQDLIIVAVKGPALAEVADAVNRMRHENTVVVPAMNGVPWWFLLSKGVALQSVDPNGAISKGIPFSSVIGCVVHASASVLAPGEVEHKGGNKIILGEPSREMSVRLNEIGSVFENAGLDVVRTDHIHQEIWYKLWGNMTMNPISALSGATCDRILDDDLVNAFVLRVMSEAAEVGKRIGCEITERGEDRNAVTRQLGAFKTSMLQDAEAGRPLEINQIVAAPREIAQHVGCETPNLDALLGLVRLFDRSRRLAT